MRILQILCTALLLTQVATCLGGAKDGTLDVFLVDVEGGAATLIVTPQGESILIDSGNPNDRDPLRILKVAQEVAELKRIDHHIVTHWHRDHYGGTRALATQIPIVRYYDHGPSIELDDFDQKFDWYLKLTEGKRVILKPGDQIDLGFARSGPELELTCLCSDGKLIGGSGAKGHDCSKHPAKPRDTSDNRASVGVILRFGQFDFLDLGDLTWNLEHRLVCPNNIIGKVDVYQTSHHGLAISNHTALVHNVAPHVVLMNCGARKGADPPVMETLRTSPGLKALFQVHRNVRIKDDDNAPRAQIANWEEKCQGEFLWMKVAADAKSYSVGVGSEGERFNFEVR